MPLWYYTIVSSHTIPYSIHTIHMGLGLHANTSKCMQMHANITNAQKYIQMNRTQHTNPTKNKYIQIYINTYKIHTSRARLPSFLTYLHYLTLPYLHTGIQIHTNTYWYTQRHTNTYNHSQMHRNTQKYTERHTYLHKYIQIHKMHTDTHIRIHTYT